MAFLSGPSPFEYPAAFWTTMAGYFAAFYLLGWVFRRIPLFRWLMLGAVLITLIQHWQIPFSWQIPAFYIFWGVIAAYIRPLITDGSLGRISDQMRSGMQNWMPNLSALSGRSQNSFENEDPVENFWAEQRKRVASERNQSQGEQSSNSQDSNAFWNEQTAERTSQADSHHANEESFPNQRQPEFRQSPFQEKKLPDSARIEEIPSQMSPTSYQFYEHFREEFLASEWTYDSSEEVFDKESLPSQILGLSEGVTTKKKAKKHYTVLSKYYMNFTSPRYPDSVQMRAHEIMMKINWANEEIQNS